MTSSLADVAGGAGRARYGCRDLARGLAGVTRHTSISARRIDRRPQQASDQKPSGYRADHKKRGLPPRKVFSLGDEFVPSAAVQAVGKASNLVTRILDIAGDHAILRHME